jgi:hypothetical protein
LGSGSGIGFVGLEAEVEVEIVQAQLLVLNVEEEKHLLLHLQPPNCLLYQKVTLTDVVLQMAALLVVNVIPVIRSELDDKELKDVSKSLWILMIAGMLQMSA